MKPHSILILYNQPLLPRDHPDAESEHSVVEIAEDLAKILGPAGYRTSLLGLGQDPTILWAEFKRKKPALVVNLFEGNHHNPETESYVAGLLHWHGVPFTGSPLTALTLARDKYLTKLLLRGAGLPTADFQVVNGLPVPRCKIPWPVIVKPARQDGSVGLAQASVCTSQKQLKDRVAYILETYGAPVLVEEFIPGREFNIALLELPELRCLPPAEITFPKVRPGQWSILTYDGKWNPGTRDYETTPPRFPADISQRQIARLSDLAMRAYRLLGCRDYARVDFRVKPGGKAYILEMNPNPEISDSAGFAHCLGSANIPFNEFVLRLIAHALGRGQNQSHFV